MVDLSILVFVRVTNQPKSTLQLALGSVPGSTSLSIEPLGQTSSAVQAGTFYSAVNLTFELSWERAFRHSHDAYSLVGLIHTLAPPKVRSLLVMSL